MKHLFLPVFLLSFLQIIKAQCPTTPVTFANQAQVNAFPTTYPNCTLIPNGIDLKIMGANITDLSPLSQLTGILGVLEIRNCPQLQNLNGLQNIKYIGNDTLDGFILRDLPALNSLTALNNLDSINGEFTIRTCNLLNSLNGLNKLSKANGSVIIRDNAILKNLNGLDSLKYIGETLEIVENPQLNSVAALSHVNTINGGIEGGIFIEANNTLANLTGLGNNNTVVGSNLDITLNGNLNLCHVPSICKYLVNPPASAVINISANKIDCNNQTEILAKCALRITSTLSFENQISIFPNPVLDVFIIDLKSNEEMNATLFDIYGKVIDTFAFNEKYTSDLTNYSKGIYFLKLNNKHGQQHIFKIVKL